MTQTVEELDLVKLASYLAEHVEGFAKVKAHAFRGGQDRARLYGSPGNDVFYALPEYSLMFGATYSNYAAGFEVVQGFGNQGGYDEATGVSTSHD